MCQLGHRRGSFSQVGAAASAQRFRPPTRLVCLFGKQAAPVAGTPVANGGQVRLRLRPARLPAGVLFSICRPHVSKCGKCEAANVRGSACVRRVGVRGGYRVVVRTAVMETEMLFLFIPPPHPLQLSLLCLERVR